MTKDRNLPAYRGHLLPTVPTLAEQLRKAGYRTLMTGKWHLGWEDAQSPNARGFDRFYGSRGFVDSYFTVIKNTEVYLDDKQVIPASEKPVNPLHPDQDLQSVPSCSRRSFPGTICRIAVPHSPNPTGRRPC